MNLKNKAGYKSQLFGGVNDICDTEEMSWLRMSDDYQSRMKLASLLISQYRYCEALEAFAQAEKIRNDDAALYIKTGGTYLTLLRYDEAFSAYEKAIKLGVSEKALAYPLAIRLYLLGEYEKAALMFSGCLPCDDELKIAVIYFQLLCRLRSGKELTFEEYSENMSVGHHTAYELAVRVLLGRKDADEALAETEKTGDLDFVIATYGIAVYLEENGRKEEALSIKNKLLKREGVWPCVSYLAVLAEMKNKKI